MSTDAAPMSCYRSRVSNEFRKDFIDGAAIRRCVVVSDAMESCCPLGDHKARRPNQMRLDFDGGAHVGWAFCPSDLDEAREVQGSVRPVVFPAELPNIGDTTIHLLPIVRLDVKAKDDVGLEQLVSQCWRKLHGYT